MNNGRQEAAHNFLVLGRNPYPGRGIVIGASEDGEHLVQVYWIMGRSENSRNRVFSADGGRVYTEPADPTKVKDPSLIIYNAMVEKSGCYVVSNGHQTDAVLENIFASTGLENALTGWQFEPDAPNFTPRITGVSYWKQELPDAIQAEISILRRSLESNACDRMVYRYGHIPAGFGYSVTTYCGNAPEGEPLPAFWGEPLLMPLDGDLEKVGAMYWTRLNPHNLVALAVKFISIETGKSRVRLLNKYVKM